MLCKWFLLFHSGILLKSLWLFPQLLTNKVFIDGFLIRYRNLETDHYQELSIHNLGSEYIVANLAKFSRYQFFLVPFVQSVLGRPSNIEEARTREDGEFMAGIPVNRRSKCPLSYIRPSVRV